MNEIMFNTKSSEKYTFGHKLQLKCNDGFELHGHALIYCMANGKWSKVQSICTSKTFIDYSLSDLNQINIFAEIQCEDPVLPPGARILFGKTHTRLYRDSIVVQCASKKVMKISCDAAGKWSPSIVC